MGSCGRRPYRPIAGEHYLISLQRRGVSGMQQCGQACELQPGDIGILDGARPFTVTFPDEVDRIVAVIPSGCCGRARPGCTTPLNRLPAGLAAARHLRIYIERLAGPEGIGRGSGAAGGQSLQSGGAPDRARESDRAPCATPGATSSST